MSCNTSFIMKQNETTIDTIKVMYRQGLKAYAKYDYLAEIPRLQQQQQQQQIKAAEEDIADAACRYKMAEWFYQIIDFCQFKKETVEVAMSNLDRFLATRDGSICLLDRSQFQLAAMTSLYTAVKIQEREALSPELMSQLSNGAHPAEAIEKMEVRMMRALQWRCNPPTSISFIHHFLSLFSSRALNKKTRKAIIEIAEYQAEIAMVDYSCVTSDAAMIAAACLINAFECAQQQHLVTKFVNMVSKICNVDILLCDALCDHFSSKMDEQDMSEILEGCNMKSASTDDFESSFNASISSFHESPRTVSA